MWTFLVRPKENPFSQESHCADLVWTNLIQHGKRNTKSYNMSQLTVWFTHIFKEIIFMLVSCSGVFLQQDFFPCESRTLFTKVNESDKLGYRFEERETLGNNNNVKVRVKSQSSQLSLRNIIVFITNKCLCEGETMLTIQWPENSNDPVNSLKTKWSPGLLYFSFTQIYVTKRKQHCNFCFVNDFKFRELFLLWDLCFYPDNNLCVEFWNPFIYYALFIYYV